MLFRSAAVCIVLLFIRHGSRPHVPDVENHGIHDMNEEPNSQQWLHDFDKRIGSHEMSCGIVLVGAEQDGEVHRHVNEEEGNEKQARKAHYHLFANGLREDISHSLCFNVIKKFRQM